MNAIRQLLTEAVTVDNRPSQVYWFSRQSAYYLLAALELYAENYDKAEDEANGKDIADLKQVVTQAEPAEEQVFDMVEQMPTFPGGTTELMKYIGEHLKYPPIAAENGTQGKVICRFVIGKDGQVRDVTIARSLDPYCDKEAIRVIKSMPKWIPGKQNGKAVAVNFTVPIVFKLQ